MDSNKANEILKSRALAKLGEKVSADALVRLIALSDAMDKKNCDLELALDQLINKLDNLILLGVIPKKKK